MSVYLIVSVYPRLFALFPVSTFFACSKTAFFYYMRKKETGNEPMHISHVLIKATSLCISHRYSGNYWKV